MRPGHLVWAKTNGYPFWPAVVCDNKELTRDVLKRKKDGQVCVRYIMGGTESFGWFPPAQLFDFHECYDRFSKPSGKTKRIPQALQKSIELALARSKQKPDAPLPSPPQPKPAAQPKAGGRKRARSESPPPEAPPPKSTRRAAARGRDQAAEELSALPPPVPPPKSPARPAVAAARDKAAPRSKAPPRLRPERGARAEPPAPPPAPSPPPPAAPPPPPPPPQPIQSPLDLFANLLPRRPETVSAAALVRMAASGAKRIRGLEVDDGPAPRRRRQQAQQPD